MKQAPPRSVGARCARPRSGRGPSYSRLAERATASGSDALAELRTKIALALRTDEDYDEVRRGLVAVAAELNQRDWSDVLDATEDFLFIPLNIDGSDLEQHLQELGGA